MIENDIVKTFLDQIESLTWGNKIEIILPENDIIFLIGLLNRNYCKLGLRFIIEFYRYNHLGYNEDRITVIK